MPRSTSNGRWLGRALAVWVLSATAVAQDWPTYRGDSHRTATTAAALDPARLTLAWTHDTGARPRPAWPGPARWDAFAGLRGLRSMRNYDPVFHPVVAGNSLWYGSSVDGALHCLDVDTGATRWTFPTGGAIRIAPTVHADRVYFGSDDGFAYCVDASSGKLVWRMSPRPDAPRLLHEQRPISFWPVRTGVSVVGGMAYFGASLLPWKPSYLCAVDAATGEVSQTIEEGLTESPPMDASQWIAVETTVPWGKATAGALEGYDGFGWYRCEVTLPDGWVGREIALHLGGVDDSDETFVNGVKVGGMGVMPPAVPESAWQTPRVYSVPTDVWRDGANLLCVRVHDSAGGGGLSETVRLVAGDDVMALDGPWQLRQGDDLAWADAATFSADQTEPAAVFPCVEPAPRTFVRTLQETTLEGALLVTDGQIVAPQGRVAPSLYRRSDGRSLGSLQGGGGVFVMLTDDQHILHGPGSKTGHITDSDAETRSRIASFDKGNALVVSGHWAFLLTDDALVAIDREERRIVWQQPNDHPHDLVLAGDVLVVGGDDEVAAYDAPTGTLRWRAPVRGRAHGLAVAHDALLVSTDEGVLYRFRHGDLVTSPTQPVEPDEAEPSPRVPRTTRRADRMLHRWVFHRRAMVDSKGDPVVRRTLLDVTVDDQAGSSPLRLQGPARADAFGEREAVVFDGSQSVVAAEDFRDVSHPDTAFSVAAWVRLDEASSWGGLVGAYQDNGAYERGWLLGYRDRRFAFSLTGADEVPGAEAGRHTCLRAHADAVLGAWNHVVATYDGTRMRLYLNGLVSAESEAERGPILWPEHAAYVLAAYRDDDEHFPFKGALHDVRIYERALRDADARALWIEGREDFPDAPRATVEHEVASGPWWRFTAAGEAVIGWETERPSKTELTYGIDEDRKTVTRRGRRREHEVRLTGLRSHRSYQFQIVDHGFDEPRTTPSYLCDTHFDYASVLGPARRLALVVGARAPSDVPACWLDDPEWRVIVHAVDGPITSQLRDEWLRQGRLGSVLSVVDASVVALDDLPVWAFEEVAVVLGPEDSAPAATAAELSRRVRPWGGRLRFGVEESSSPDWSAWASDETLAGWDWTNFNGGRWATWTRGALEGAGSWTHMYGRADNTAFGGETLGGASGTDELEVQWIGRPGPRHQSDRQNRKPSPLAVGGRLFVQGLYRLIALDAFHGAILWTWELPRMARFNVPRDCANWCADETSVFVAIEGECWQLDARTGDVMTKHALPGAADAKAARNWGYLARAGDVLLGSDVDAAATFEAWWGGEHWYDGKGGSAAGKVASDVLFAQDATSGQLRWRHEGVVLNPTITVVDGAVLFVESRLPAPDHRRLHGDALWEELFLVCLDVRTGKRRWETGVRGLSGDAALYLAASDGRVVLTGSRTGQFKLATFALSDGTPEWTTELPWETDHHGKHLSRPAIASGRLFLRPHTLDWATGEVQSNVFPGGHTCSSYTLTASSMFLRAGSITMWQPESERITRWSRLRPDCWISTVPANGLLLSPEGGGGCSCGSWMEMSMAFRPVRVP